MSRVYIPKQLRERVATRAGYRCAYCRTSAHLVGTTFEIDHIIPESLGGRTEEENLCLACPTCNGRKSNRVAAIDEITGETILLFDPNRQPWHEHFGWNESRDEIIGLTPTGRATVTALDLNRPVLVYARCLWVRWGRHPPED